MKKTYYLAIASVVLVLAIYLYWAHWFIYHQLGTAGLNFPSVQSAYNIGMANPSITTKLYAAVGDSLTAGVGATNYTDSYPHLLSTKLARQSGGQVELRNFSYPGYRSADVISNLLPQVVAAQPDVVTLLIGVNDIHGQVSLAVFKQNYEAVLKELTTKTKAKIYLINLPLIGSNTLLLPPYQTYFKYQTVKYNQIIAQLAVDYHLPLIDLYTPTVELFQKDGAHYSADSFHPSVAGYQLWAQLIYDAINR